VVSSLLRDFTAKTYTINTQNAFNVANSFVMKTQKRHTALNHSTVSLPVNRFTFGCGKAVAWLLVAMVSAESLVVALRYGFDIGSIALQESITYVHACCFLLGAAYTLQQDEHVRVDIFYRKLSAQNRALVNILGFLLLLLPTCGFIIWSSIDYVAQSWSVREASADAGGLPGVYLLKTLIPVFAALLILQGGAQLIDDCRQLQNGE